MKRRLIIAGAVIGVLLLVASHIAVYVVGRNDGLARCTPTDIPQQPTVKPRPNIKNVGCSIQIGTVKATDDYMAFVATAAGESICDITIPRPTRWQPVIRKHWLMIGFNGGYYGGAWLPGGSIDYLYRIGAIKQVEFFCGPGLTVAALDEPDVAEHVSVSVRLSFAALW
jgi:hypothetical protein